MSVFERQRRFAAGAQALLERRQQAGRHSRSEHVATEEEEVPVGADQVLIVPSLRSVCAGGDGEALSYTGDLMTDVFDDEDDEDEEEEEADEGETLCAGVLADAGDAGTASDVATAGEGAGGADLEEALAAIARVDAEAAAAAEAGREWSVVQQVAQQVAPAPRGVTTARPPSRKTRRNLASLTRLWHLWRKKRGLEFSERGPTWEQVPVRGGGWDVCLGRRGVVVWSGA